MADLRVSISVLAMGLMVLVGPCGAQGNIYLTGHDTLLHNGQAGYDIVILDFLRGNVEPRASYSIGVIGSGVGSWSFSTGTSGYPAATVYDTNNLTTSASLRAQAVSHDVLIILSHVSCVGCSLTSAGSDVLNQQMSVDIINAFNNGMDLWVNSGGTHPTYYDFLPPGLVTSAPATSGSNFCPTAEGTAIGINLTHTAGYAAHNRFAAFSSDLAACETVCAGTDVISLCGDNLRVPPILTSISRQLQNTTGGPVDGVEFLVEGSFSFVQASANASFSNLSISPVGPDTELQWTGATTPNGGMVNVGFGLSAASAPVLAMAWTNSSGTPVASLPHVTASFAANPGGVGILTYRNDSAQTVFVGNLTVEFYSEPPALSEMVPGGNRTPIGASFVGGNTMINPMMETQVPIAVTPPPLGAFALLIYEAGDTAILSNPTFLLADLVDRCANALATPPNFVANNGGAVGGMVYFTLDVLSPDGVSICSLDVNTSTTGTINGLVYLHQSITDWNQLTGTNNTMTDWCNIACLKGTANPEGTPSPMTVINATNSIDLPMGQYLLAVGNGNFDHRYTDGNGPNQNVSDGNLTYDGGQAADAIYSATLSSPRVFNVEFNYDVWPAPVTLSPCGATCAESTCVQNGVSCGEASATIFELFDAGNPWDLTGGATQYSVCLEPDGTGGINIEALPVTQVIMPAISADLRLGDDESSPLIPLGFTVDRLGVCADSISVDSNGCVWLGVRGISDPTPTPGEFESLQARIAPCWTNLRPLSGGGGGTIHVDILSGSAFVTYNQVFLFGTATPVTFQVQIVNIGGTGNGDVEVTVVYDSGSAFPDDALVGFHNGIAQVAVGGSNLNGGPINVPGASPPLTLTCNSIPFEGGSLDVVLAGVPPGGLGAVLAEHSLNGPGFVPTYTGWNPTCFQYVSNSHFSLGFTGACTTRFRITMPPVGPPFLGTVYGLQGVAASFSPFSIVSSNGVDARLGNY